VIRELDIKIEGGISLQGEVEVSSSKNAVLPILAASLLTADKIILNKIPRINDVLIISELLKALGLHINTDKQDMIISGEAQSVSPPYELVRKIRASFLLMGPLIARYGQAKISLPGGCAIGARPIDLHLKGFEALGAKIELHRGDIIAHVDKRLKGNHIYLDFPSVGATENIMMAASLADGITYIENAALEPEVVDLANFINRMGGKIKGAGTNLVIIKGVKCLRGTDYTTIPDRIEAGTYMLAVAATGGNVIVKNVVPEHVKAISAKLTESGAKITEESNSLSITRIDTIKPIYIKTLPYPGFPTDLQAQFMAYLSHADGSSIISESVFENRFMHVPELKRMGAEINIEGRTAIIKGVDRLSGTKVKATDLRAGAALIIAALTASGSTLISECEHIERGYEKFIDKLSMLGASIKKI